MRRVFPLLLSLVAARVAFAEAPPPPPESPGPENAAAPAAPPGAVPAPAAPQVPSALPEPAPAPAPEPAPEPAEPPPSSPEASGLPAGPAHTPPMEPESEPPPPARTGPPRPRDFGIELDLGFNARLGENGSYAHERAYGVAYGVGTWVLLAERVELGFELTHAELGRVSNERGPNLIWAEYGVTTLWLGGRFEPWRGREITTFVALRIGLGAQTVDARGTREQGSTLAPADEFACSETDGPGFALGGGAGAAWLLGPRVQLVARVDATAHRLESDWLGRCAIGIGSATSVGLGLGFAYGFELTPAS